MPLLGGAALYLFSAASIRYFSLARWRSMPQFGLVHAHHHPAANAVGGVTPRESMPAVRRQLAAPTTCGGWRRALVSCGAGLETVWLWDLLAIIAIGAVFLRWPCGVSRLRGDADTGVNHAHPRPRAEETRKRLIEAGIELFGRDGFDAVTTRQLAEVAGVNQAAIPIILPARWVYQAVAASIAASGAAQMAPVLAAARHAGRHAR